MGNQAKDRETMTSSHLAFKCFFLWLNYSWIALRHTDLCLGLRWISTVHMVIWLLSDHASPNTVTPWTPHKQHLRKRWKPPMNLHCCMNSGSSLNWSCYQIYDVAIFIFPSTASGHFLHLHISAHNVLVCGAFAFTLVLNVFAVSSWTPWAGVISQNGSQCVLYSQARRATRLNQVSTKMIVFGGTKTKFTLTSFWAKIELQDIRETKAPELKKKKKKVDKKVENFSFQFFFLKNPKAEMLPRPNLIKNTKELKTLKQRRTVRHKSSRLQAAGV